MMSLKNQVCYSKCNYKFHQNNSSCIQCELSLLGEFFFFVLIKSFHPRFVYWSCRLVSSRNEGYREILKVMHTD